MWGNRTIIPPKCRQNILDALHTAHPGIVRMKALARSYVWWPQMDADIERAVKLCIPCQETRHEPPKAELHAWETTHKPWSRLHIDFAGPFRGKLFLIVVDSYSKWLEVFVVKSTSSQAAIKPLRSLFATFGIPDSIVSDNATVFTSDEFKKFMDNNLIRHIRVAPFHPSSNGQAERMVQTKKDFLKKMPPNSDIELSLSRFLLKKHITPSSTTNRSPAELLFNRQLKSYFDKIHPNEIGVKSEVVDKDDLKDFDAVWCRNYSTGPKWIEGTVVKKNGPLSYSIQLKDSRVVKRHLDQIRKRIDPKWNDFNVSENEPNMAENDEPDADFEEISNDENQNIKDEPRHESPVIESSVSDNDTPRRSSRVRRPPNYYDPAGC